jgi:hypothetical protein
MNVIRGLDLMWYIAHQTGDVSDAETGAVTGVQEGRP